MADRTRAKDQSTLHKYRIELPVLIDDMELSVYARSLYIHIKRRAGDQGSCYESARALAKACGMSAGQVSKAKDELESRGLIIRNIKYVRGGIADDISIVDIWPETFRRYAPESEQGKESDHHTITSVSKRSSHDHLSESDHHTITLPESDQAVIALTSKRSPHDPKNHDSDHVVVGVVGDRARESFFQELRRRGISRTKATQIATLDADPDTILVSIDNLYDPSEPKTMGGVITMILDAPPPKGQPYERRPTQPESPPRQSRRSAVAAPNPAVDAELAAQLAKWERQAERGGD